MHCRARDLSLGELVSRFDEHTHAILAVLFGAVFFLPVPLPGVSVLFGAIIALVGIRMAEGKGPWLPRRWANRIMPGTAIALCLEAAGKVSRLFETVTRPRLGIVHESASARRVNGTLIAILGALLFLPLPPGTNFPPAFAIVSLAVGTMERDGYAILLGYAAFLVNVLMFSAMAALGYSGVLAILAWLGLG